MRRLSILSAFALAAALAFGSRVIASDTKETDEALSTYKKAYASKDESARLAAVEQLAAVQHAHVVDALASALAKDAAPSVRRAAAKALGKQWSSNAAMALAKCLNPDDPARDVTTEVIRSLGETESDVAVGPLVSLLTPTRKGKGGASSEATSFTGPALDALGRTGSSKAIEEVLAFLNRQAAMNSSKKSQGGSDPLSKQAESVLEALTGQHASSPAEWRKWWAENKASVKEIAVYRCPNTGTNFDKTSASVKCPADGDQHASCGYLLKTRLEGSHAFTSGSGAPSGAPSGGGKKGKK